MKKGFTLVELLAVVIIICMLSFIVTSAYKGLINKQETEISSAMEKVISSATNLYVSNSNKYVKTEGNVYCIKLQEIVDAGNLTSPVQDPVTHEELSLNNYIKVKVSGGIYEYKYTDSCVEIKK